MANGEQPGTSMQGIEPCSPLEAQTLRCRELNPDAGNAGTLNRREMPDWGIQLGDECLAGKLSLRAWLDAASKGGPPNGQETPG